jgi:hypothetical protein
VRRAQVWRDDARRCWLGARHAAFSVAAAADAVDGRKAETVAAPPPLDEGSFFEEEDLLLPPSGLPDFAMFEAMMAGEVLPNRNEEAGAAADGAAGDADDAGAAPAGAAPAGGGFGFDF